MKFLGKPAALLLGLAFILTFASCENAAGGGTDTPATYTITVASGIEHGTVTASATSATAGTEITLTAMAETGYERDSYTVTAEDESTVSVAGGKFTMPAGNVTVSAKFVALSVYKGFVRVTGATVSGAVADSKVFIEGRTVTIGDLWVCDHEVTQGEYQTYCNFGMAPPNYGQKYPAYCVNWYDAIVYCNLRSMEEGLEPVYKIEDETDPSNWKDIASRYERYCGPSEYNETWNGVTMVGNSESTVTTANGFRLPTEAEWEYVAPEETAEFLKRNTPTLEATRLATWRGTKKTAAKRHTR